MSALIERCKNKPQYHMSDDPKEKWEPICEPRELRGLSGLDQKPLGLTGANKDIVDADDAAEWYRGYESNVSLGILAVSFLPLLWYFMLDRLREVSAALSGRDRQD